MTIESDALQLKIGGQLQAEMATSSCGDVTTIDPRSACTERAHLDFLIRRARIRFEGKVTPLIDFKLEADFSDVDDVTAKDVWARFNFDPALRVKVGNFKRPFDGFQLTSSSKLLTIERDIDIPGVPALRTLSLDELTERFRLSNRDVGIMLEGEVAEGRLAYWFSITDGQQVQSSLDTLPNARTRAQFMWRVQAQLEAGGLPLDVAAAFATTDRPFFVEGSEFQFAERYFQDVELWAQWGRFDGGPIVQAELMYGDNPFENEAGDFFEFPPTDPFATALAWQVIGAYRFNRVARDAPNQRRPIVHGIQPIFRVTMADPNLDGDREADWGITPGVQIFFYGRNKLALNWDFAVFADDTESENSFKAMVQAYF